VRTGGQSYQALGYVHRPKTLRGREFHRPLFTVLAPSAYVFTRKFGPAPLKFGPAPRKFGPAPLKFGPAPRKFGPAPLKFGPEPRRFGPAALRLATLVGATLLTSGLVTIAFLLAVRLLISDFFSIDITCSSRIFFIPSGVSAVLHSDCQTVCINSVHDCQQNQQLAAALRWLVPPSNGELINKSKIINLAMVKN